MMSGRDQGRALFRALRSRGRGVFFLTRMALTPLSLPDGRRARFRGD